VSAGFFAGVALVLTGVAWLGFVVELMGFFALFGNYFPYVFSFVKTFGSGCAHCLWRSFAQTHHVTLLQVVHAGLWTHG
jgi:hypothetical protein